MHSAQLLSALAVALSAFSVAQAAVPDPLVQAGMGHQIVKRQSGSTSRSASSASSSTSANSPSTSKTTPPATTPATTTPRTTPSSEPAPSSSSTNSPPAPSTTPPQQTSSPQTTPPTSDGPISETSTTPPPTTSSWTTTIVTTNTNGQVLTMTSEGTTVKTPGLASDKNNAPQQGLSEQNRNIIIGCVVGVGGAIILAVVGVVAWRVWGRKKSEETDGAFGPSYSPADKPEQPGSQSSRTPFQSTLESYHAPTQVNTASNF